MSQQPEDPPRRLRRLPRIWRDDTGTIRFLVTLCTEDRAKVLATEDVFTRLANFLATSPAQYRWFGNAFVVMPDHLHTMATMGHEAVPLGQWVKAMKAVVAGLEPDPLKPGRMRRVPREWRWQEGFHDHKFRRAESAARKWEYIMMNPVRAELVDRPELWPFTGEIIWDDDGQVRLKRHSPPLLDQAKSIPEPPEPL